MWYRLYNFLLGGRNADNIDLNYYKKNEMSCLILQTNNR